MYINHRSITPLSLIYFAVNELWVWKKDAATYSVYALYGTRYETEPSTISDTLHPLYAYNLRRPVLEIRTHERVHKIPSNIHHDSLV